MYGIPTPLTYLTRTYGTQHYEWNDRAWGSRMARVRPPFNRDKDASLPIKALLT